MNCGQTGLPTMSRISCMALAETPGKTTTVVVSMASVATPCCWYGHGWQAVWPQQATKQRISEWRSSSVHSPLYSLVCWPVFLSRRLVVVDSSAGVCHGATYRRVVNAVRFRLFSRMTHQLLMNFAWCHIRWNVLILSNNKDFDVFT